MHEMHVQLGCHVFLVAYFHIKRDNRLNLTEKKSQVVPVNVMKAYMGVEL